MSYKSPIEIAEKMSNQMENDIMKAIISYNINVDKDELIKALAYDRKQYEKGYEDGQRDERTAKVENYQDPFGLGGYGDCSECGAEVNEQYAYCPNCGCRLEWK